MWLNSGNHGAMAVKLLLASIKDNTPLPEKTYRVADLINADNFAQLQSQALPK